MLSKLMLFMIYLLEEENTSRSLHLDGVVSAHQRFLQFPAQTSGSCLLMLFTLFCIAVLALEHSRWDLWGHCYVPVRSWVRSSTFRDWGQNRPIKLLHAKSLLFISTLQYVSYGPLTKTFTCKTIIFHLHVPIRELWVFNKGFYMQNQHLSISTFQHVSYGSWTKRKKRKKQADLMLLYTFTCKINIFHLHVRGRELWFFNTTIVLKQNHVRVRSG